MTNKPANKALWLLTGAAGLAALVFLTLWLGFTRQAVVEVSVAIENSDDKVCYFTDPNFQLRWIHSVEKQWWEEQYQRIDNDMLLLTTTYFEAFGAGTPSTEPLAPIQKPGYLGYQINETLPNLNWVVSRLTKGEIDYGDHRFLIHQWVPDYSEVVVMPKTYGLIDRLNKDLCHELPNNGP